MSACRHVGTSALHYRVGNLQKSPYFPSEITVISARSCRDFLKKLPWFLAEVAVISATFPKDFLLLQGVEQSAFLRISRWRSYAIYCWFQIYCICFCHFWPFFATYCHLPPNCHHPTEPLFTGISATWWQYGSNFCKTFFMQIEL